MPQVLLTDLTVQSLKTEAAQADFYCSKTPRFGVRFTKGGCKTFFVFHPNVPARTRYAEHPFRIPLGERHHGKELVLEPDGRPLIIEKSIDGVFAKNLYLLKEIDLNTEPLTSATERASWQRKFERYKIFFERRLYASHYGFSSCLVLVVTTSVQRMNALLAMKPPGYFLFRVEPNHARASHFPSPGGGMVTETWRRAGASDFRLDDPT